MGFKKEKERKRRGFSPFQALFILYIFKLKFYFLDLRVYIQFDRSHKIDPFQITIILLEEEEGDKHRRHQRMAGHLILMSNNHN